MIVCVTTVYNTNLVHGAATVAHTTGMVYCVCHGLWAVCYICCRLLTDYCVPKIL